MQQTKKFKAPDGKTILVEVNRHAGNKKAALIIHGFTGHVDEHIHYNAAQTFPAQGVDTWRISLYPGEKNTRSMATVRWANHLQDIEIVLRQMQKSYKSIFLIGHSIGGTVAVHVANPIIKAKILWDPSYKLSPLECSQKEIHRDFYTIDWGCLILVSKVYSDECDQASFYKKFPPQPALLVITAPESTKKDNQWPKEKIPAKIVLIPHADHCFHNEGAEKKLFAETLKFIMKIK